MGKVDVLKETTPLSSGDCFLVMQRRNRGLIFRYMYTWSLS